MEQTPHAPPNEDGRIIYLREICEPLLKNGEQLCDIFRIPAGLGLFPAQEVIESDPQDSGGRFWGGRVLCVLAQVPQAHFLACWSEDVSETSPCKISGCRLISSTLRRASVPPEPSMSAVFLVSTEFDQHGGELDRTR